MALPRKRNRDADPDREARETLRLIGPDPASWVPDRAGIDHNVAIIGGGQTGATFAFALRRAGIGKVTVIDAAEDGKAGIWLTHARMNRLRTPKSLPGPELGLPGLSFQSWYEGRHGAEAYAAFDRIARTDWAKYLKWYREFLGIEVRYRTRLVRVDPAADHLELHLETGDGATVVETTRKVILANGFGGSGGAIVPPVLARLPTELVAHTSRDIDFARLDGKAVAVVGAAASAFDAAATALEAGAASVHLFARRDRIASVPINRVRGYPGAYDNYPHLPDAIRWRQALRFRDAGSTPPPDVIERVVRFANFHLHLGALWTSARLEGGKVVTDIAGDSIAFDFVIAGTGYFADPSLKPELAGFADRIRLWRHQYTPPAGEEDAFFGAHPYLGLGHEFLEKTPGEAPFLKDIHVYNPGGFVSFGLPIGDVPSIKRDVPAVVSRISRDLFLADLDSHERRITGDYPPEFGEEAYASAVWRPARNIAAE
ncbi:NAD(P)-binding domain-containing protein [Mesorhizobium sp.]|uniref:FAD/NAD(P)-binding protein n=2 Tax=unclassified Mesorhizobium TaxID=325217 RepID=UPI000FE6A1B0|nr:NAD(P)-binding domain-containing protein [Mesorhizobium sp.]RWD91841.1 MAG: NAD(P)/FAD-dependent oxidoreductase [Mesorhizobium sp.]RWD95802.1 MAG: NAD(P)/FAD-dependent oxidoreductase [Mesorhizobium sp.]